jgi:hypothetical protein
VTLVSLLEHVGIHVPRFVTVDGRIVFDPELIDGTMPSPLPIAPHRFHGGDDPVLKRGDRASAWWNTAPEAREIDESAMARQFPNFIQIGEAGPTRTAAN